METTRPKKQTASLPARLASYQAERFPVLAYLPLMVVGTFAALAFSRAARQAVAAQGGIGAGSGAGGSGLTGFPWLALAVGSVTLLAFFFTLRVLDEHKDAAVDAAARPELPVPRGLVALRELRWTAGSVLLLVVVLNVTMGAALLLPMAMVLGWSALMGREFFVADWLRARPLAYLLSHMVVMPLIFLYATSLDWLAAGAPIPPGTGRFLAFAFFNGLVIEMGRKIRSPSDERPGVETYTAAWGAGAAVGAWATAVVVAAINATLAAGTYGGGLLTALALAPLAVAAAALPAFLLARRPEPGAGKRVEVASGLWALTSYATFGGIAVWLA
jgi:hypothetical protein